MRRYLLIFYGLFAAVLCFSCSQDPVDYQPTLDGEVNVSLSLDLPGGFLPAVSRSLTSAQENRVEDLTVLVFDRENKLCDIKQGRPTSETTWGVTVAQSPADDGTGSYTFNLVVIANAQELIKEKLGFDSFLYIDPALGQTETEVREHVLCHVDAKMYTGSERKSIPMWGETGQHRIDRRNPNRTVKLLRSLSRIDVGIGTPTGSMTTGFTWDGMLADGSKFDLQKVYVVQLNQYLSILPHRNNITDNVAMAVTLPPAPNNGQWNVTSSLATFAYGVTGGYTSQEIYVPESDIRRGSTTPGGADHENRMAIVVAGSYQSGPTTYYRLDFAHNNALMDVLRNHIYQFNIKKVSGPGYETPEDAYKSLALNMEADVVDWNIPAIGDIVFDGQYHFGIETRDVYLKAEGETRALAITTNHPSWSLSGHAMFTYNPTSGTPASGSLTIAAAANGGETRSETVTITAGRNKITLKVTQMGRRTLSFNSQGGSAVGAIAVGGGTAGHLIAWPAAPTLIGKKFGGWYTSDAGVGTRADGNSQWTMPDANTTLFARWVDEALPIVVFDKQGGKGGTEFVVKPAWGTAMPEATAPRHDYGQFLGYWSSPNGGGTQYYNASMEGTAPWDFTAQSSLLYAHWLKRYQLTYWDGFGQKYDGSLGTPNYNRVVDEGTNITDPGVPTREGYNFKGWSKAHPFTIGVHTDITALWDIKMFKATFDPNGGIPNPYPAVYMPYGSQWKTPEVTREHYTLLWWRSDHSWDLATHPPVARDEHFTASWAANTYTMTFDLNGGTFLGNKNPPPVTVTYPAYWSPVIPSKAGYTYGSPAVVITNGQQYLRTATANCHAKYYWTPSSVRPMTCAISRTMVDYRVQFGVGIYPEYQITLTRDWNLPKVVMREFEGSEAPPSHTFEWVLTNEHGDTFKMRGHSRAVIPLGAIGGTVIDIYVSADSSTNPGG